jgi:hypothetical protein
MSFERAQDVTPQAVQLAGREAELATLLSLLGPDGPRIAHVHGVPGIGKTSLLRELAARASRAGIEVRLLDCRAIEPTEHGMLQALAAAGMDHRAQGGLSGTVCLDNYDSFLLLDAWIRDQLSPRHGSLRLVLCSRRAPNPAWLATEGLQASLRLRELDPASARLVLERVGISGEEAERILEFARGHPLALRLAGAAARHHRGEFPDDLALHEVVHQLSGYFLDGSDADLRAALEAMSTVRRLTIPMLSALCGETAAGRLYERLAGAPVVETRKDGLVLHPAVHEAIAQRLRASDPARFTAYRRAAWRELERTADGVAASDLWRYTADVIHLVDNPIVREAFFPSAQQQLAIERARPADRGAVLHIAETHDGSAGRAMAEHWWSELPTAFHVVHDAERRVVGCYIMFDPAAASTGALSTDPMTRAWAEHLSGGGAIEPRKALFLRRWLGLEAGEAPSPVQAACWLDVKRAYLELRPSLQRVYLAVSDLRPFAPAAQELGFEVACADASLPHATAMLEFGPGSVDAWLRRLVRRELRLHDTVELDEATHELVVDGTRTPLTQLEFGVMRTLVRARGGIVGRELLLDAAWGRKQDAVGSNVVDVVVLALRKKLGARAGALATVRGSGYRLLA